MNSALGKVAQKLRAEPVAYQSVVQAGLATMVGFGVVSWTPEQTGLVLALSAAILGVLTRSQVKPTVKAAAAAPDDDARVP
jgi:hypothetical protein